MSEQDEGNWHTEDYDPDVDDPNESPHEHDEDPPDLDPEEA